MFISCKIAFYYYAKFEEMNAGNTVTFSSEFTASSVVDPDLNWIRSGIQLLCGSGSELSSCFYSFQTKYFSRRLPKLIK